MYSTVLPYSSWASGPEPNLNQTGSVGIATNFNLRSQIRSRLDYLQKNSRTWDLLDTILVHCTIHFVMHCMLRCLSWPLDFHPMVLYLDPLQTWLPCWQIAIVRVNGSYMQFIIFHICWSKCYCISCFLFLVRYRERELMIHVKYVNVSSCESQG